MKFCVASVVLQVPGATAWWVGPTTWPECFPVGRVLANQGNPPSLGSPRSDNVAVSRRGTRQPLPQSLEESSTSLPYPPRSRFLMIIPSYLPFFQRT